MATKWAETLSLPVGIMVHWELRMLPFKNEGYRQKTSQKSVLSKELGEKHPYFYCKCEDLLVMTTIYTPCST